MHFFVRFVLAASSVMVAWVSAPTRVSAPGPDDPPVLFHTSDRCLACHKGVTAPDGRDISIGYAWRASMMANSARDPYWHASVRRETIDHPSAGAVIEDECATCHMPMATHTAHAAGRLGKVFANLPILEAEGAEAELAADGVSCTMCHQIQPDGLGSRETFNGDVHLDATTPEGARTVFGPFETDAGRRRVMRSSSGFEPVESSHVQSSELCGSCHTLFTKALDANGEEVGELPEQVPFLEWKASAFVNERSCQACHMPEVPQEAPVASVLGQPRANVSTHTFHGGNFFMLRMLDRYRDELGVEALPQELDASANETVAYLRTRAARLEVVEAVVEGDRLTADVTVTNLAGHKLPTAYPSRRAWLHVTVRDAAGRSVFESGAHAEDGHIVGNDNDEDATRFEPHYAVIDRPDQVQIYEGILADPRGNVTTGLLRAVGYTKDNRILPRGFAKADAEQAIAVHGGASTDDDFTGGSDRVRYVVDLRGAGGPFTVEAELWYQPIGYRWAHNLADYDAEEPARFVRYYDSMAAASATPIAEATAEAR